MKTSIYEGPGEVIIKEVDDPKLGKLTGAIITVTSAAFGANHSLVLTGCSRAQEQAGLLIQEMSV